MVSRRMGRMRTKPKLKINSIFINVPKSTEKPKTKQNPFRRFYIMYNTGLKALKLPMLSPQDFIDLMLFEQLRVDIGKILIAGGLNNRQMDYLLDTIAKKHYVHKIPNLFDGRMVKLQLLVPSTQPSKCVICGEKDCSPAFHHESDATIMLATITV